MAKQTARQMRNRLIEIAHDLLAVRDVIANPQLTGGGEMPIVFRRAYLSTASMLEAEAILVAQELGHLAEPPQKPEPVAAGK